MKSSYSYINGSIKFENVVLQGGNVLYCGDCSNIPIINKFPVSNCILPIKSVKDYSNITIKKEIEYGCIGDNLWYGNIAHALLDGLYPIYLSMIKFGDIHNDFVYFSHSWDNRKTLSTEAINTFSGNELVNTSEMSNKSVFCKNLVSGCGTGKTLAGNCVINKNYKTYGQEEHSAFSIFKERMLSRFGLFPNKPINSIPKVIIVHNKRFSDNEVNILKKLEKIFNKELDIRYINWYHDYNSFGDQMNEIQDVDIQISGPGTGMLYLPFLKNGAVNINLGYIDSTQKNTSRPNIFIEGCTKDDHLIPGWMEQSVCSATEYVSTLYYDRYNSNILEIEKLSSLLKEGLSILGKKQINNWNVDALVFKEYCKRCDHAQDISRHLTNISFFVEFFVNEHPKAITDYVDLDLLRQIKKEFGYGNKYSILMNGI
jgi:hypothetical protein